MTVNNRRSQYRTEYAVNHAIRAEIIGERIQEFQALTKKTGKQSKNVILSRKKKYKPVQQLRPVQ